MTACATCHPPAPGDARLNENHTAIRFGDRDRGRWTITLDGADVTNRCIEALAGAWAILHDQPLTICTNGDHARTTLHHGHVDIECERR